MNIITWNLIRPNIDSTIPEEFGDLDEYVITGNETVLFTNLVSGSSESMPFNGNALEAVSDDDQPFVVAYSMTAYSGPPVVVNNFESLANFNASGIG